MGADGGAISFFSDCYVSWGGLDPFMVYKTMVIVYTTRTLHLSILFSIMLVIGIRIRIIIKYRIDASWPMMMNGCSTGWPPIHVSVIRSATRIQNRHWLSGRNVMLRCFAVCKSGNIARIRMEATRASTPPNLFGIDRRMAYANRKYHSGLIWGGVLSGLAGV